MLYSGDVRKMANNLTKGRIGTDGLFEVVISVNYGTTENTWEYFETTALNVSYEEGVRIEGSRLAELRGK
jgi:hypothetical protein